tara:strand:+ start:892 stop:1134 length:243 start_codon:yes stop_codon:yes gene_type:complete
MNIGMFIIGTIIFSIYVAFLIWNIFYGARKNMEENYPDYYDRHGSPNRDQLNTTSGTKSRRGVERTVRVKHKKVRSTLKE